jgi:hypothetical protein
VRKKKQKNKIKSYLVTSIVAYSTSLPGRHHGERHDDQVGSPYPVSLAEGAQERYDLDSLSCMRESEIESDMRLESF